MCSRFCSRACFAVQSALPQSSHLSTNVKTHASQQLDWPLNSKHKYEVLCNAQHCGVARPVENPDPCSRRTTTYVFETATPELLYNTMPTPAPNYRESNPKDQSKIGHYASCSRVQRIPESRRAFCSIVSFTAANTSRIFDVSVACVRLLTLV